MTERADDGVIELRPKLPTSAKDAWFWDEEWQKGEREVDEHTAAGRYTVYGTAADFAAQLRETSDSETR
ncbi:MAG: hypothetical protein U0990_06080 [Candidatus Nanopelagicales bacterium]|nr:hypothetical protein [Candidatus Nanopelagicales bacterium]MDZ4249641.1 hypothetical protein [Candidatus Nanopelagicales bacterium]